MLILAKLLSMFWNRCRTRIFSGQGRFCGIFPAGPFFMLFLLDTLKTTFWMEYLTQRRTLSESFSAKSGHFFLFSKKGGGDLPLLPLSGAYEMRSNSPKILILCLYTNLSLYSVVYDGKQKVGLHVIQHKQHKHHDHILKHTSLHKKWSFPLRVSSVNMTKSTLTCGFGQTYRRNP